MSGPSEDDSKQYEPTERKLEQLRKKGNLPRSTDVYTACAYAGFLLALLAAGWSSVQRIGGSGQAMLEHADQVAVSALTEMNAPVLGALIWQVVQGTLVILIVPFALVLGTIVVQRGMVFSPQKLAPDLSRISPVKNAKNKYGRSGLFEFAKSFVKLSAFSIGLAVYLASNFSDIASLSLLGVGTAVAEMGASLIEFVWLAVILSAGIGVVDLIWQLAEHRRRNMMSHKEIQDEAKEAEGDPYLKGRRRALAREIANKTMMKDMQTADVVIVNPTHYAVALKWDPGKPAAPVCVAKGVDLVAARMRDVAREHSVPIRRDPPTARALYASVDIGDEIDPLHYRAVAAAIRFSQDVRRKQQASYGG